MKYLVRQIQAYSNKPKHLRNLILVCIIAAFLLILLLQPSHTFLTGQVTVGSGDSAETFTNYPLLPKCSGVELQELFGIASGARGHPDPDTIDVWSREYHRRVDEIISEHLSGGVLEPICDSETVGSFIPPGDKLLALAQQLPAWQKEAGQGGLSRHDIAPVLQEYLRLYECALVERNFFLPTEVVSELRSVYTRLGISPLEWSEVFTEFLDQRRKIGREVALARPILNRVLTTISGMERFQLLEAEVECLQRASIDARNAVAISAETASCLPRIWDSKDPLRDRE